MISEHTSHESEKLYESSGAELKADQQGIDKELLQISIFKYFNQYNLKAAVEH